MWKKIEWFFYGRYKPAEQLFIRKILICIYALMGIGYISLTITSIFHGLGKWYEVVLSIVYILNTWQWSLALKKRGKDLANRVVEDL